MNIGILALQGGYQAHAACLKKLNVGYSYVRHPNELKHSDALIIPGGESAVFIKLLSENNLWDALIAYKKPILGTCAGAILLAKKVCSPAQATLNRINITIERNAYGRQLSSHIATGTYLATQSDIEMLFIRAPKITAIDKKTVSVLVSHDHQPMAAQEGNCIAATFHPELSRDSTLHRYFIQQVLTQETAIG
ncbi:pyridoxal 5'-phosphate synthase glutaminase subunit PdxT [Rickettsiella endosymbiont of Dermanyssus gallinae]|uniref:pyridoxal 5'-phosphate synthase glutaminase subunit PdxT n=1 Tax=Rickettsiella endosymbiont of Dermanyssus gallinae TaxID=2856608 RepID=UPI001C532085|nr:pyridoxal 5'-phosphate synthase glutaminase subunit PdxT [Rickettsiella endosymbiont of Dermanyssus gallinae]